MEVGDFPRGVHAQLTGLGAKPELNEQHCTSLGPSPGNPERVTVTTRSGAQLSLKPINLKLAELLPGCRVVVQGLENAAKYNGQFGEVLSWHGDRWIVDLENKERKSFRPENLVIMPASVATKKRAAPEAEESEAKKLKSSDFRQLESSDERVVGAALLRIIREFPIVAMKCICILAWKQQVTIQHDLANHLTDKMNDGLLRRPIRPGEKVKGIEELDALEQCSFIAEKRIKALASYCRINYCDLLGFLKAGFKEPKFNRLQNKL